MTAATETAERRPVHGIAVPAFQKLARGNEGIVLALRETSKILPVVFRGFSAPPHLPAGGNQISKLEDPEPEFTWEGQKCRFCRGRRQIWGSGATAFQYGVLSDLTESIISRLAEPNVAPEQWQETKWRKNRIC